MVLFDLWLFKTDSCRLPFITFFQWHDFSLDIIFQLMFMSPKYQFNLDHVSLACLYKYLMRRYQKPQKCNSTLGLPLTLSNLVKLNYIFVYSSFLKEVIILTLVQKKSFWYFQINVFNKVKMFKKKKSSISTPNFNCYFVKILSIPA